MDKSSSTDYLVIAFGILFLAIPIIGTLSPAKTTLDLDARCKRHHGKDWRSYPKNYDKSICINPRGQERNL